MNISDELALSYYKPVADIAEGHSVQLVQHTDTKKFFVRKHLQVYHLDIYRSLQTTPVQNIPRIELLVEDDTGLTIIEEYIQGETLQEQIEQNGSLPEERTVDYALQLCRIVSNLHHRNPAIIHRDIKPSNVIVSPDGVIKLLDMNAAKYVTPNQSRDTMLLGTAGYAAPEQYGFAPSGVQSDLFAIGVLINVMATGKMPAEKMAEGKLEPIIRKCIELDPANRYASVDELIHEINRTLADEPMQTNDSEVKSWRQFLPPGFRSGSVPHMIIAIIGYALIFYVGFNLKVENATPFLLAANRATAILMGVAVVFFTADYCGVEAHFPLARSKNPVTRIFAIVLYDIIIVFVLMAVLVMVESII